MTPQAVRVERLLNDHEGMQRLEGDVVTLRGVAGTPPDRYDLIIRLRTIIRPKPEYRDVHEVRLTVGPGYPAEPPLAVMQDRPAPFHPNWFVDGRWCHGGWSRYESLADYVVRLMRTLQFSAMITNPGSAANGQANRWYLKNLSRGLFPTDQQVLPDPTPAVRKFKVIGRAAASARRFTVQQREG